MKDARRDREAATMKRFIRILRRKIEFYHSDLVAARLLSKPPYPSLETYRKMLARAQQLKRKRLLGDL